MTIVVIISKAVLRSRYIYVSRTGTSLDIQLISERAPTKNKKLSYNGFQIKYRKGKPQAHISVNASPALLQALMN